MGDFRGKPKNGQMNTFLEAHETSSDCGKFVAKIKKRVLHPCKRLIGQVDKKPYFRIAQSQGMRRDPTIQGRPEKGGWHRLERWVAPIGKVGGTDWIAPIGFIDLLNGIA
jgi:hypothetical protein